MGVIHCHAHAAPAKGAGGEGYDQPGGVYGLHDPCRAAGFLAFQQRQQFEQQRGVKMFLRDRISREQVRAYCTDRHAVNLMKGVDRADSGPRYVHAHGRNASCAEIQGVDATGEVENRSGSACDGEDAVIHRIHV